MFASSSLCLQIMADFRIATNIEDPVSIVLSKWNAWVPKIFHKAKLEGQNQKKTFKDYMPVILECTSQPEDDIYKRKELCACYVVQYHIASYFVDPDIAIALILLRKLLNEKMPKGCTELLVILEVSIV